MPKYMTVIMLAFFGLALGSFINALIWRIREQESPSKKSKKLTKKQLSISSGRSMCIHCHHELAWYDLVPVFSWLLLKGKCRYCGKSIDDSPIVEVLTAAVFVASYIWWPNAWDTAQYFNLGAWLLAVTALVALLVYDLKWMLLPNRITYPLLVGAALLVAVNVLFYGGWHLAWMGLISAAIAGGLFLLLFYVSNGKWIGGGDVKLGLAIGLLLMDPTQAFLMLFLASLIGTAASVPAMLVKKLKATSRIPFGPFLIVSTVIVRLFGAAIIAWYKRKFLTF